MIRLIRILLILTSVLFVSCGKKTVTISCDLTEPRIEYGVDKLTEALIDNNYNVLINDSTELSKNNLRIVIASLGSLDKKNRKIEINQDPEGFRIQRNRKNIILITGNDRTGALYGCLELADKVKSSGSIPKKLNISEHPEMVLRGSAIGLQKPELLPGRKVYEYPITPENFPWFYDQTHWVKYLDMLVENRMNSLYLWNGHPFASLVKIEDYPFAVEVTDSIFEKNREMFSFITSEADKRGIWVIQMFYNIIVSEPFAVENDIETQRRSRPITPLISDYTRKSVTAFIENYPNVGLMICLGEAMNTIEDDINWFTETIIPGVKDGLESLGESEYPPIILRGHDTDAKQVMEKALPKYHKLYTTYKYNGESLTTYDPQTEWIDNNLALSDLGSVHISNVHILANLEPFRYGSPDFIQKSTQTMHKVYKANGLHLYPQASYWDWPYTADKTETRLYQIDRDWVWYKAWGRYAWEADRNRENEIEYWGNTLGEYYGSEKAGKYILTAYEESGEIAPKLLRKFGISDGNRQTLLLGMFMSQLVNPEKYRLYESFVSSSGPPGERMDEYAEKEINGEAHAGETPVQIINEVLQHGKSAREAIDKAAPLIKGSVEEFDRLKNDIYCYDAISRYFANKAKAALLVLDYKYSGNQKSLTEALPYLEKSVVCFKELSELTRETYLYANSMQTQQRRIPISGRDGTNKTWEELLPQYELELVNYRKNIEQLASGGSAQKNKENEVLMSAIVNIEDNMKLVSIKENEPVYEDQDYYIEAYAPELKNLQFLKLNYEEQLENGTHINFNTDKVVKLVVAYFNGHSYRLLTPPTLETNANANDRGQADIKIANALTINGLFPVNIYTYTFEPGENSLDLGPGIALILGFMDGNQDIITYDAGIGVEDQNSVDWLFY